jgi:branched-chain amino acid transport system substrate-binding protein
MVTSLTGVIAPGFVGGVQGAQARFALQNDQGGVNGRKLKLVPADDMSSPAGAQTAVNLLISKGVFEQIWLSDVTFTAAKAANKAGVPILGLGVDGPEWNTQPNTNMVHIFGDSAPTEPVTTLLPLVAKMTGAKNMAVLAIANEPPSITAAQDFIKGAKAAGEKVGLYNASTPIGSVNVTALALAMKQAGVDGFQSAMLEPTNFALMTAARQEGINLVAPLMYTGYDQTLLSDKATLQAAQGGIFEVDQVPVEEKTPATLKEQAAFLKYEHFSGVPNLDWTVGWLSADLTIQGLQQAGQNPTRASFLNAVRNLKGWDGGGLLAASPNFSLAGFGQAQPNTVGVNCDYFVRLTGSQFVPINNGKAICGNTIP